MGLQGCSLRRTLAALLLVAGVPMAGQQDSSPAFTEQDLSFFETSVRPILRDNCLACHNEKLRTSELSLESRHTTLAGGNRGPAVKPGDPAANLLIEAVTQHGDLKMPPPGRLRDEQIATLRRWIELGVPWPESAQAQRTDRSTWNHWAAQPPKRHPLPAVENALWVNNAIDSFVLARLEKEGLRPSAEADRRVLPRRVCLDLTGLPPSPKQIEEFLADTAPGAYERLVDRLLASPHYGERWGRHWLDVARYADSNGYNIDAPRDIWLYRDWVIQALNEDLPFDQFVIDQIAGDLRPNPTVDQLTATGFHRNTLLNFEGGIDFEQYRVEAVVDRVATTGSAFLGLTLGCARCHDHKYDPISQREFYQLYAFFNNIDEMTNGRDRSEVEQPVLELPTPKEAARLEAFRAQMAALDKELEEYEASIAPNQKRWESELADEEPKKLQPDAREALKLPVEERTEKQKQILNKAFLAQDLRYQERKANRDALLERHGLGPAVPGDQQRKEPKVTSTLIMRELPQPRETHIHLGGDFLRTGVRVYPAVPSVLPAMRSAHEYPNRLDLARWLVDPENPLTARVTVNRLWQYYFGRGLVATENDFGTQGETPSHPKLLDWLATEFVRGGWSQKAIHRLIVTSATYRQSSEYRPELSTVDPNNRLLGRQTRARLEAEVVRDAALVASGLLTPVVGGPSVFPPIPKGAMSVTQIKREWHAETGPGRYRRGMYTFFWRAAPYPGLMVFDAPDSTAACTRRARSNTPLQALTLLNSQAFFEFAQALAVRILREAPADNRKRIDYGFLLSLAREPEPQEQEPLEQFLATQLDHFQTHPEEARSLVADAPQEPGELAELAAWTALSRVLLNLDEFITRE